MWILIPMIHGCINICWICSVIERGLCLAQMLWTTHHGQGLWMWCSHHPWIICDWWHLHMHWVLHSLLTIKWVKSWSLLQKCIFFWQLLNFFSFLLKIKNSLGNIGVDISFLLHECRLRCCTGTLYTSGSFHCNRSCNWDSSTRLKILHLLHLLHLHHLLHWVELRIS